MHSMRNGNPISQSSPSALKSWVLAARPKTLIAGISPVLIGTSFAAHLREISGFFFLLCLLFSLSIQIGTNWANDYFDFVKGADTATRKGPMRAVQSGWISPLAMRNGAFCAFGLSLLFAAPLLKQIGAAYLPLALLCPLAGILYTGGKKPLGYLGLGDLLVFVFFGPVAICCTALTQLSYFPNNLFLASLAPGSLSCAILAVANLRDAEEDRKCKKMTLIARFGVRFGKLQYLSYLLIGLVLVPLFLVLNGMPPSLLTIESLLPLALYALKIVFTRPEEHTRALGITSLILTLYTALFCYALLYV